MELYVAIKMQMKDMQNNATKCLGQGIKKNSKQNCMLELQLEK